MELNESPLWKFIPGLEKFILFSNENIIEINSLNVIDEKLILNNSIILNKNMYAGNLNLELLINLMQKNIPGKINGGSLIQEFILRVKNKKLILINKWCNFFEKRTLGNEWTLNHGCICFNALVRQINFQRSDGTWTNPNGNITFKYSVVLYFVNAGDNLTLEIIDLFIQGKLELDKDINLEYKLIKNNNEFVKEKIY